MAEEFRPWLWRPPEGGVIGKTRVRRKDGYEKTSGKAVYTRDVYRSGMLYGKLYTSPHAHAKIISMDTSKAEALPGVRAVLRYDDPEIAWPVHTEQRRGTYTQAILPGVAHWYPEPVGVFVVAETEAIVDRALKLVEIEWEVLPFILDPEEAMKPGAILVRPEVNPKDNLEKENVYQYGDVEKGLSEGNNIKEWKVIKPNEDVWAGAEPNTGVAEWKEDYLETWIRSQSITAIPTMLAKYWGIPKSNINVHIPYIGAIFGGLQWTSFAAAYFPHWAVIAAKRTGRPVKVLYDGSCFHGSGEIIGSYYFKVAYTDDGRVTALKLHSYFSGRLDDHLAKMHGQCGCHNLYNLDTKPFVNRGAICCYKHGDHACLVATSVFNHVAAELKMDPTEVALINDGSLGETMGWINENIKQQQGFDPTRDSLKEILAVGKKAIDWDNKWHQPGTKILPNGKYHGIGFTWMEGWEWSPGRHVSAISMETDGTVNIVAQHGDGGWCGETTYCQVVADEIGLNYNHVTHRPFDYAGFYCCAGGGSHGMNLTLTSLIGGARKVKQQLLNFAVTPVSGTVPAFFPDKTPEALDIKNSEIFEKANPTNKKTVAEVAFAFISPSSKTGPLLIYDYPPATTVTTATKYVMARQCYFEEIEVDPDTGGVEVKKVVVVNDVGRVMTPESCEGQQYGGTYMGVGGSFTEAVYYDPPTGVKLNDNLIGYAVPVMNDIQGDVDCHLVETALGYAGYGTYGIGENAGAVGRSLGVPAVHNAIGVWVDDFPITPDKILKALGKI